MSGVGQHLMTTRGKQEDKNEYAKRMCSGKIERAWLYDSIMEPSHQPGTSTPRLTN